MRNALERFISSLPNRLDILGPIFRNELVISARQTRTFVIRTLYVSILVIIVLMAWHSMMSSHSYPLYRIARMSRMAVELLMVIGGFQFFAMQILSPIFTCNAISDEISRRTLDTLLTTPITSLQFVIGKLASRLLIMTLLVCASLPILAIIRVCGGIEWRLVISLVVLTLCTALFNATVSLTFSIFNKRAYVTVLLTYFAIGAVYFLIPLLVYMAYHFRGNEYLYFRFNPIFSVIFMLDHGARGIVGWPSVWLWPSVQCAVQLAGTLALVIFSSIVVRRVAIRQAVGAEPVASEDSVDEPEAEASGTTRLITDYPVLWRETHQPLILNSWWKIIAIWGIGLILFCVYGFAADNQAFRTDDFHMCMTSIYWILAMLFAAVLPATTITQEKEANTWEVLMTTPLTGWQIVAGKFWGVLRRWWPMTLLYFGHMAVFMIFQYIQSYLLLVMIPLVVGPAIFLIGAGVWISLRTRHTTTAVLLNIGLGLLAWLGIPLILLLVGEAARVGDNWAEVSLGFNPLVWNVEILDKLSGFGALDWKAEPGLIHSSIWRKLWGHEGFVSTQTLSMFLWVLSLVYGCIGYYLLSRSARRLNRRTQVAS